MDFDPEDQEIIRLLGRLKGPDEKYPEHLRNAQRQNFLKRISEIELGISTEMAEKNIAESAPPPTIAPATSTLLETALLVAIVVEASAVVYFYREKLADFFGIDTETPRVQVLTSTVEVPASLEIQGITPSPLLQVESISSSSTALSTVPSTGISVNLSGITATSTSTPIPGVLDNNSSNNVTDTQVSSNATPIPNGNNGNHYGQTPKPERTKENNGNYDKPPTDNNDPPPHENNDKPPKDHDNNPPPEEEPKPTKSK